MGSEFYWIGLESNGSDWIGLDEIGMKVAWLTTTLQLSLYSFAIAVSLWVGSGWIGFDNIEMLWIR